MTITIFNQETRSQVKEAFSSQLLLSTNYHHDDLDDNHEHYGDNHDNKDNEGCLAHHGAPNLGLGTPGGVIALFKNTALVTGRHSDWGGWSMSSQFYFN